MVKPKPVIRWPQAWRDLIFRRRFLIGVLLLSVILACFPAFFNHIQDRAGKTLSDPLLALIAPRDLSIGVFGMIWACAILILFRNLPDPVALLRSIWTYNLMTVMRMASIWFISLEPPAGLIPLRDPITNEFYGERYITHDLFFSGHTATLFVIFFCLQKKADRLFAGIAASLTGILLLIQHVHYSIDVLAAPVFAWIAYRMAGVFSTGMKENSALTSS